MTAQAPPVRAIGERASPVENSRAASLSIDLAAVVSALLGLLVLLSTRFGIGVPTGLSIHLLAVATLVTGGAVLMGARRMEADERRAWTAIGAGVTIAGFGQAFRGVVGPVVQAVQQAPDLFSIAAAVVLASGLVRLPHIRSTRIATLRIVLDMLVAMVAASAVLWDLQPELFEDGMAAPLLHALLFGSLFVAFLRRSPYVRDLRLGVLSMAVVAVVTTVDLGSVVGSASSLGRWSLAVVLLAVVATLLQRPQARRTMVLARPGKKQLVIPGVPVAAFGILFASRVVEGSEMAGTVLPLSILLVSLGLAARSAVTVVEGHQLTALERDQLLASLSHELRTPLTAVSGFSQVLTSEWEEIAESERRELIELIDVESGALVDIVGDLNALARSELDAVRLDLERVEGRQVIADAVRLVFDLHGPLPIKAEVEPYLELVCDRRRMVQVLRALFENALRYGNGKILVVARRTKSGRVIEVHDDGAGVERRHEKVIWKRFERGAHELNANVPGSGLGLAVVRAIARAHDGEARYRRSDRLGGACFSVELPYDRDVDLRAS